MPTSLTQQEIRERNRLIVDLLTSAKGEEVHINDIAWFLQLDPQHVDDWMRQYGLGLWITGKNRLHWRGICKQRLKENPQ